MARPMTKAALISAADEQWSKVWNLIDAMTDAERNAAFMFDASADKEAHWKRDKNLRDVLIHLYEWHELLLRWVDSNMNGVAATFLPPPYNWKTYGEMNVGFWEKHQTTPLNAACAMLRESHGAVVALIERFDDESLFTKQHFDWVGGSTLGSYCVSVTSSHYDWAVKKVKHHIKAIKEVGL